MELFSITCTTCKSRLKVRDKAAIGQILACPKCGGMVMVKPPPAFHEASDQRSDVATATELSTPVGPRFDQTLDSRAFDVVDELLSDAPPKVQKPPPNATPPAVPAPAGPKARFVGGPKVPRPATTPPDSSTAVPPPPPQPPQSAEEALPVPKSGGRQWLLIGLSVGLGVALAFAAVTATILLLRGSHGPVRPTKTTAVKPLAEPAGSNAEIAGKAQPAKAAAVDSASPPRETASAEKPATAEATVAATASDRPPVTDPIGIVAPPAPSAAPETAGNSNLAQFDNLLGGGNDDPLSQSTTARLPSPLRADSDSSPARPLAPRPPPRDVDVAKRLADPLVSIETAGTPLADFAQLISDLSTIPITLEPPLLPATTESPVVLKLGATTVGAALAEGLKPLRLEVVAGDGQLVIRRLEPAKFEPISRPVKDLTGGGEAELAELAELLRATVEPSAWTEDAGGSLEFDAAKGVLEITQRRAVQLAVLIALEKLRAAHKPPLAHELRLDASLFQAATRYARATPQLEKSVSLNFSQPTRLLTILERLAEATGVRIIIDWQDVAAAGWNPAAEARLLVSDKPLAETLDALLDPLDLAWRVIDAKTVQVVTPSRLASQGEFELYPVESLVGRSSGAALLEKIQGAMANSLSEDSVWTVRYDERTKCLLAWLPQPHQQVLELLLTQWKAEDAR